MSILIVLWKLPWKKKEKAVKNADKNVKLFPKDTCNIGGMVVKFKLYKYHCLYAHRRECRWEVARVSLWIGIFMTPGDKRVRSEKEIIHMKRLAAILLVLGLMLGLCACGGAPVEETTPVEISTEAATEAPTEAAAQEQELIYHVLVIDNNDNPVPGVTIRLSNGASCDTDEMGVATFALPAGEYTAVIESMPMGYDYAAPQQEVPFEEGMQRLTIIINSSEIDPEDLILDEGDIYEEDASVEEEIPEEDISVEEDTPED